MLEIEDELSRRLAGPALPATQMRPGLSLVPAWGSGIGLCAIIEAPPSIRVQRAAADRECDGHLRTTPPEVADSPASSLNQCR